MSAPLILYHFCKGKSMSFDPVLRWKKSPSAHTVKYTVGWKLNGSPVDGGDVNKSSGGDISGYSLKFSVFNPLSPLVPDDVLEATISSVDGSGLASAPVVVTVTVPSVPPDAPTDVTLSLV
jgi:hypothetical protein